MKPFRVNVSGDVLDDLRSRVSNTRWPPAAPGVDWQLGTDLEYLRTLASYWAGGFNWLAAEARINSYPQFLSEIDGVAIHFVHSRASSGNGTPIVLTHGWPSAFIEYLPVLDLLSDSFDVVVPSLPGYGFSQRPLELGVNYRRVAAMWHALMAGLGYERYAVGGGDFGAGVASLIALDHPESVIGVHLTNFELLPRPYEIKSMTHEEQTFFDASSAWWEREDAYKRIQGTKPQTLSYALTDSPVGVLAWILEKWRSWTDCAGDPAAKFGRDFMLELATIYWLNGTIATSVRDYYDNRWHPSLPGMTHRIERPTAFAVFDHYFGGEPSPPRSLVERLYDVTRWTEMPRGGHFAAIEEPQLVAADIAEFFAKRLT